MRPYRKSELDVDSLLRNLAICQRFAAKSSHMSTAYRRWTINYLSKVAFCPKPTGNPRVLLEYGRFPPKMGQKASKTMKNHSFSYLIRAFFTQKR